MKYSELDTNKLNDNDIYDLIMTGIKDYSEEKPTEKTNPDFLVVLGCSPVPLKARVVKMMHLHKKGYGKYILFSGGTGWHKLFKPQNKTFKDEKSMSEYMKLKAKKFKDMKKALHDTVGEELKPNHENPYQHRRRMKKLLRKPEAQIGYKIMKACQDIIQIDGEKIFYEQNSTNTIQNLEYSKKLLDDLQKEGKVDKINRIMIITSSFHCRRAELSFKKYFPDVEVMSCPATMDITNAGILFNKNDLMSSAYYMQQFRNELNAIVNYTRNGSIADLNVEDVLGAERTKKMEEKMHDRNEI